MDKCRPSPHSASPTVNYFTSFSLLLRTHLAVTLQMLGSWSRHAPLWPLGRTAFRGDRDAASCRQSCRIRSFPPTSPGTEMATWAAWASRLVSVRPVWHGADLLRPSHGVQRRRPTPLGRQSRPTVITTYICYWSLSAWTSSAFRVPGLPGYAGGSRFDLFRVILVVHHFWKIIFPW